MNIFSFTCSTGALQRERMTQYGVTVLPHDQFHLAPVSSAHAYTARADVNHVIRHAGAVATALRQREVVVEANHSVPRDQRHATDQR